MGLFDSIKKQLRKVIEWDNEDGSLIAYKYPLVDRDEIMKKSVLVVSEGQKAIFVQEGKLADVFTPGTYKLDDIKNIPILTKLYNWKYAWESPYKGDIYFVSTKQFIDLKWGTANPVMMRDQDFGMVRVRGFGKYSFSLGDPTEAMSELFGGLATLSVKKVENYFRSIITSGLSTAIAKSNIAALDLSSNYDALSRMAKDIVREEMAKVGIKIDSVIIENLSLPEEVEKMMDKRTSIGVMNGSMNDYATMETIGAMRDAAKTPNSMAGMGVGLGAGMGLGGIFAGKMAGATEKVSSNNLDSKVCAECGAEMKKNAKFCPICGKAATTVDGKTCPNCGAKVSANAKFCPECGKAIADIKCPKCGKTVSAGVKFCPECGEKIK